MYSSVDFYLMDGQDYSFLVWYNINILLLYSSVDFYLTNGRDYSFFVRLWFDGTMFADFKTNGIMISTGSLALALAGGKAVSWHQYL